MSETTNHETTTAASGQHTSTVHIPKMSGESIEGWTIFGAQITTTIFTTWIILAIILFVSVLFNLALRSKSMPKIKNTGLVLVKSLDEFISDFVEDKAFARRFFFLIAGFFLFILLGNLVSLFLDWLNLFVPTFTHYLRPINSDLNTTLAMAATIIILSQVLAIYYRGPIKYLKGYLFHYHGDNVMEKCINVFVGWLHLIGEFSKLLSLSFRLFGNILAGVVLIGVISFLTGKISLFGIHFGEVLVLPFWFFELFVAVIQAIVFLILMNVYLKEAKSVEEH